MVSANQASSNGPLVVGLIVHQNIIVPHCNHKAIFCDICENWTRLKCTLFTGDEYSALPDFKDEWYYSACLASIFPCNHFNGITDFVFALFDFNLEVTNL